MWLDRLAMPSSFSIVAGSSSGPAIFVWSMFFGKISIICCLNCILSISRYGDSLLGFFSSQLLCLAIQHVCACLFVCVYLCVGERGAYIHIGVRGVLFKYCGKKKGVRYSKFRFDYVFDSWVSYPEQ